VAIDSRSNGGLLLLLLLLMMMMMITANVTSPIRTRNFVAVVAKSDRQQ